MSPHKVHTPGTTQADLVATTRFADRPEPYWHRKARRFRQIARGLHTAASLGFQVGAAPLHWATAQLDSHHGSSMPDSEGFNIKMSRKGTRAARQAAGGKGPAPRDTEFKPFAAWAKGRGKGNGQQQQQPRQDQPHQQQPQQKPQQKNQQQYCACPQFGIK